MDVLENQARVLKELLAEAKQLIETETKCAETNTNERRREAQERQREQAQCDQDRQEQEPDRAEQERGRDERERKRRHVRQNKRRGQTQVECDELMRTKHEKLPSDSNKTGPHRPRSRHSNSAKSVHVDLPYQFCSAIATAITAGRDFRRRWHNFQRTVYMCTCQ